MAHRKPDFEAKGYQVNRASVQRVVAIRSEAAEDRERFEDSLAQGRSRLFFYGSSVVAILAAAVFFALYHR